MAIRGLHIAAIAVGSLSLIFVVVALAMPAWLQGCLSLDKVQDLSNDTSGDLPPGQSICINLGFFETAMSIGQLFDFSIGVEFFSMPKYFAYTAIILIVVACILVFCIGLLIVVACVNMDTYEAKTKICKYTERASYVFVIAGIVILGSMIYYTVSTSSIIHNPLQFFVAFGRSVASAFSGMQGTGGNDFLSRGKRDLDLTGLNAMDSDLPIITTMIEDMDPMYSHSFYLAWVSFVTIIISGVLAFFAKRNVSEQPYAAAVAKA